MFTDQIHLADVLVANKVDLYSADDDDSPWRSSCSLSDPPKTRVVRCHYGEIGPALLDAHRDGQRRAISRGPCLPGRGPRQSDGQSAQSDHEPLAVDPKAAKTVPQSLLDHRAAACVADERTGSPAVGLSGERVKGLFRTDRGWMAVNDRDWSPDRRAGRRAARLVLIDRADLPVSEVDRQLRLIGSASRASA